jgi:hypothetical protein
MLQEEVKKAKSEYSLAKKMYDAQVAGKEKFKDEEYPEWAMAEEWETFGVLQYKDTSKIMGELYEWQERQIQKHGGKPFFGFANIDERIVDIGIYGEDDYDSVDDCAINPIARIARWREPWADKEDGERGKRRIESKARVVFKGKLALQIWPELKELKYSEEWLAPRISHKSLQLFLEDKITYETFVELSKSQYRLCCSTP